ncbi:MAG: phosphoribosylglycinamide formyltransferase [Deltaproteobacteria bacterium]|nr:phosphoribosylglycinamide formyltransferase [Deltaproteobacteria bacterium]
MIRIGVLASGSGTNLQAIFDGCRQNRIDGQVVLTITNNPLAGAIARSQRAGIPCRYIDHRLLPSREAFDAQVAEALGEAAVDLVALAGFMRIVTPVLIQAFQGRIMNVHPALLPSFPGLQAPRQALRFGVRFTGCTVHFVTEEVDGGPIILQAVVPVAEDDSEETLQRRIQEQEHIIYPKAIQLFAQQRLVIEGRRVLIRPAPG